jgi:adenylate cyclase
MNRDKHKNRTRLIIVVLSAIFVMLLTQLPLLKNSPIKELELKLIDSRFAERGPIANKNAPGVVLVEITENTYNGLPFPHDIKSWPRSIFAKLIRNLTNAGAKAVGIDIIMSNPDLISANNDSVLFKTIKECKNVVLAGEIPEQKSDKYNLTNLHENFGNIFFPADSSLGTVQVVQDNDGVLRSYIPYMIYSTNNNDNAEVKIPTFGFALLNKFFGAANSYTAINNSSYFLYDGKTIPKFNSNSFLVNFYGEKKYFPTFDFLDIVDDKSFKTADEIKTNEEINTWDDPGYGLLNSGLFKNKIVIIGSGNYLDRDIFHVSYAEGIKQPGEDNSADSKNENRMYGVMFHATAIQNILNGDYIKKESGFIESIIVLLYVFASFYLTYYIKKIKSKYSLAIEFIFLAVLAGLFFAIKAISFYAFSHYNYLMSVSAPCLALVIGYVNSSAYEYIAEKRQKVIIKKMFSQYVNSTIVDELVNNPDKLMLKGEMKDITILFSDIEGFSSFSESMEPENLVQFLNDFFDEMTKIVIEENGTLDKFIGDSVMAFWGAPLSIENHALSACKAALKMQSKLDELQSGWKAKGYPALKMRIGINSGEAIVGNVGGKRRFNYTVMGNNVNIASRLEGANKQYGTKIIASADTYKRVMNNFVFNELGGITPKGISKEIRIYEVLNEM